jgi:DNA-binding response OmpR family regulator
VAKVLVINDEVDLVDIVAIVLQSDGHETKVCVEGRKAADVARRYCPDIILLDWKLRETDGARVLSRLRADEMTRSIPVIMMSASPEGQSLAEKAGADAFLPKPFAADSLVEVVTEVLRGSAGDAPCQQAASENRNSSS